jgi:hypothetical protein
VSPHAQSDPIARLAAADPARSLPLDADAKARLWERILAGEGNSAPLLADPRRGALRPRTRGLLVLAALLLAVLAALAVGGVIEIGSRAKLPFSQLNDLPGGYGALLPGTVRTLPITAPDPAGGPAWGMRELSTTRERGCLQIGRLLDGKLGALGQDHAFHDDGRFHQLPLDTDVNGCELLDGNGRLFANVTAADRPASAWVGTGGLLDGCVPATAGPYEKLTPAEGARGARPVPICPQSDLRNVYYGLLGPKAQSITYVLDGQRHTLNTVGTEGAYMFVTRASAHQLLNFAGAGAADVVPVDGPVREIHYGDGSTCHLTRKSWIGGRYACTPSLPEPYGYAAVGKAPAPAEAAATIHTRLIPNGDGRSRILLSFRVPLAITDARRAYSISWRGPWMPAGAYGGARPIEGDTRAGATVTRTIGEGGPSLRAGVIRGTVVLQQAIGAGGLEGPGAVSVPVGSFSVRVR